MNGKNIIKDKYNLQFLVKIYATFILCLNTSRSFADWQHHNSFLIGERGAGMGGAYTAISNDPSGIYYNPGGIAFAKDTEISVATVGYYIENIKINSIFGITDYRYEIKNSDIISGFLGFTNKFTLFDEEFYFGVAVYVPDHTNVITNLNFSSPSHLNNIPIKKYISISRETGNESNYQVSLSKLINNNMGLGISLGIFNIQHEELTTNNLQVGPITSSNLYNELDEIINYCNDIFKDISFTYCTVNYSFDTDFKFIRNKKFVLKKKADINDYEDSD